MSLKTLENIFSTWKDRESIMEVIASGLTLAGAGIRVSKTAKGLRDDYKNAKKEISHAQRQGEQLRSHQALLNELPPSKKEKLASAEASLNDA